MPPRHTRKMPRPIDTKLAKEIVKDLLKWDIWVNDGNDILEAIEIQIQYRYSFWDSMIIQAAVKSGAKLLLSEDLSEGKIIDELKVKNPFVSIF